MKREQLEHVIRAAAAITEESEFVAVGSQAALVSTPYLPKAMSSSPEIDLFVDGRPDLSDLLDGTIGEASAFHQSYGHYAHGVGPDTALLPAS